MTDKIFLPTEFTARENVVEKLSYDTPLKMRLAKKFSSFTAGLHNPRGSIWHRILVDQQLCQVLQISKKMYLALASVVSFKRGYTGMFSQGYGCTVNTQLVFKS